jgi:hypothetical protein
MASRLYLLDASVLITANNGYYGIDRVPEFWEWLVFQGGASRCKLPIEIYEEIKAGRKDEEKDLLLKWAKETTTRDKLVLDEEVDPALANRAVTAGYASDLTDDEIILLGRDPFLLAYAMKDPAARCIVTVETTKKTRTRAKSKMPDVCEKLGVRCVDTIKFLQELDFRTTWKPPQG